jgi:type IV pilus assembly protein PilW
MRTMPFKSFMRGPQRGFTLVEIMVALLLGLFLLGALLTIVQSNRHAFVDQNQLSQLHDSERMAMSLMSDVIQSAGYFPDPTTNTSGLLVAAVAATAPAPAPAFVVGQAIGGTAGTAPLTGTVTVRYVTAPNDGILNCSGLSNTSGANVMYTNTFRVSSTGASKGQLVCTMNGTDYSLVSGVVNSTTTMGITNMKVLYGVKASAAALGNNVDTYLTADLMTAANWQSVISVVITLTFTNPLYTGTGSQPASFDVTRTIGLMNQVGPSI